MPSVTADCGSVGEHAQRAPAAHPLSPPNRKSPYTLPPGNYASMVSGLFAIHSPSLELDKSALDERKPASSSSSSQLPQPTPHTFSPHKAFMGSSELAQPLDGRAGGESEILFEYPHALKPYRPTLNSWFASLFAVAFGFPLDSVKTRLQTYKYNGNWHCIVDTYKNEGIIGFYRGLTAPLISSSLMRSWSMSIFTYSKPYTHAFWSALYDPPPIIQYTKAKRLDAAPDPEIPEHHLQSTIGYILRQYPVSFCSGLLAGISTSFIASPFELTKLGSQIELVIRRRALELELVRVAGQAHVSPLAAAAKVLGPSGAGAAAGAAAAAASRLARPEDLIRPSGTFNIALKLIRSNGWGSLYAGYRYMFVRDAIGSGVYFGVYDSIRSAVSLTLFDSPEPHPVSVAIAGGLSGAFSWVLIYPLDTIKSRYQRDVMAYVFLKSAAQEATPGTATAPPPQLPQRPKIELSALFNRAMYRGLGISLLRTSILGMSMFSCYEKLMEITA